MNIMSSYLFKNQVKIVIATIALHNYIRMHARQEMDFEIFDETEGDGEGDENDTTEDQDEDCQTSSSSMDKLRDEIAASLVETINL